MSGGIVGFLNGKPCWSPAARTRDYEFGPSVKIETENQALLREAAQVVADAVQRGLVRRAEENTLSEAQVGAILEKASVVFKPKLPKRTALCACGELMGRRAAKCKQCWAATKRIRAEKPRKTKHCGCGVVLTAVWGKKCADCSRPMRPCKACGTVFRPREKSAKACSRECLQVLLAAAVKARTKQKEKTQCVICGVLFTNYRNGSKPRKTCSMACKRKITQENARKYKNYEN